MSVRVRFSAARPGVAYVGERTSEGSGMAAEILSKPMPPLHKEDNFRMDAHTAASIGDVNVIEQILMLVIKALLASKKLDPNEKNRSEWTPLLYAAYLGHNNVCAVLIEAGARTDDCNHKGQTPLMMASSCGNLQVMSRFKNQGHWSRSGLSADIKPTKTTLSPEWGRNVYENEGLP
ncbi:ankyrin repeat protein [Teladorsagia circumcincta]|uniref:Ankyrin repeat protein n=1 Tax=Teladorsagia circumcincta TaxID=45464 RepID=A0A2G9TNW6_TELCI|nr:ankyrin repeat protein [Teladorsagia circumcincta]